MLKKIDDAIYAAERGLTVLLIALMASAVFVDVTHRKFSEPVGNLERILGAFLPISPEMLDQWVAPGVLLLLVFLVAYGAFRTAEVTPRIPRPRAAGFAAATAIGGALAVKVLLVALPNGLIFSQKMALCMLLWVGFLGASMATREGNHIVFEVADRIWPRKIQKQVRFVATASAVLFSVGLAVLAIAYTSHSYADWAESGGVAGRFEGFDVPQFTVYGFLPIPFLVMAFRFALYGVFTSDIGGPAEPALEEKKESA